MSNSIREYVKERLVEDDALSLVDKVSKKWSSTRSGKFDGVWRVWSEVRTVASIVLELKTDLVIENDDPLGRSLHHWDSTTILEESFTYPSRRSPVMDKRANVAFRYWRISIP